MAWMRFTRDFDWKPKPAVTIAYKAGMVENVTRACAAAAAESGVACRATNVNRTQTAQGKAADDEISD